MSGKQNANLIEKGAGAADWFTVATVRRSLRLGPFILIATGLTTIVYYPITRNYFLEDDFLWLYLLKDRRLLDFVLRPHGGHILLVRNLLFALFHAAFGTEPQGYFWAVLVTHVVNVALLFHLIHLLTRRPGLACGGATLWGINPLHESTLGWYSVYGEMVVATILLVVLCHLASLARTGSVLTRRAALLIYVGLIVAGTCFAVGIAIAMVFPAILVLFLPRHVERRTLLLFFSLMAVMPTMYVLLHRLHAWLTDSVSELNPLYVAILLKTSSLGIPMFWHLVSLGTASAVLGPYGLETRPDGLVDAVTGLYWVAAGLALLRGPSDFRRELLASLLLALSAYAIIAFGRGGMFATMFGVDPASAATLGRYHYVSPIFLVLGLCLIASQLHVPRTRILSTTLFTAWLLGTLLSLAQTRPVIDHHALSRRGAEDVIETIRAIIRASPSNKVFIPNQAFPWAGAWLPRTKFPGWAGAFEIFFPGNVVDGRRVYFVEPDEAVVTAIRARPWDRTASLLVTPREAAQ